MPENTISDAASRGTRGRTTVYDKEEEKSQIEAVHIALLHTSKVLYYSGFRKPVGENTKSRVWQKEGWTFKAPSTPEDDDLFCAGHAFLPDGRLLSTGGTFYRDLPPKWLAKIGLRLDKFVPARQLKQRILNRQGMAFCGPTFLYLFDPKGETWMRWGKEMDEGRWYPTNTALPDGGILILSGRDRGLHPGGKEENKKDRRTPEINKRIEVFYADKGLVFKGLVRGPGIRAEMTGMRMTYGSHQHIFPTEYPRLHVLPLAHLSEAERAKYYQGRVFCAGYGPETKMLNLATWEWEHVDDLRCEHPRHDGNSVLLPLSYEDDYRARVLTFGGSRETQLIAQAIHNAEIIDFSEAYPTWRFLTDPKSTNKPLYVQGRVNGGAILLPDGKVMAIGGNQSGRWDEPVMSVDIFDPRTDTWDGRAEFSHGEDQPPKWISPNTKIRVPRGYHATALLLPDASVLVSGTTPSHPKELRMEIYSPYYLDDDPQRPEITGVEGIGAAPDGKTAALAYAKEFQVNYTVTTGTVTAATLLRPGAMTHSFDMEQRHIWLRIVSSRKSNLKVIAPPDRHVAPPGYYMLFLLDERGVPSIAEFVWLPPPPL